MNVDGILLSAATAIFIFWFLVLIQLVQNKNSIHF